MKSSLLSPWRKKLYKIITFSIWSPSDKTQCVPVGIQQVLLILRNSTKESQKGDPSPLEGPGLSPEEYWHHAESRTLPRAVLTKGGLSTWYQVFSSLWRAKIGLSLQGQNSVTAKCQGL